MFILIISRGIPSKRFPQWGCFEKDQAEALASIGHKVVVVSVDGRFRFIYRKRGLTHVVGNNGVEFYNYFLMPAIYTSFLGREKNRQLEEWQLRKCFNQVLLEHGKPDVIVGHFSSRTAIGVKIAEQYQLPLVGIEHDAAFNYKQLPQKVLWNAGYAYAHTQQIIAVSSNLKERILYYLGKESVVVPNTVGKEFMSAPCASAPMEKVQFIGVGNLIPRKGYDLLIRAFAELQLPAEKWMLTLVGDGEAQESLQQQINNAHLQRNIVLAGKKDKREIVQMLSDSNYFMMPSRNENFSVAILEALACGLPVISSDCGGAKDCINAENGLLFPVDDVESLKECIKKVMDKSVVFNNQAIAQNCRENYAPEVIAHKLSNVFEQTINDYRNAKENR